MTRTFLLFKPTNDTEQRLLKALLVTAHISIGHHNITGRGCSSTLLAMFLPQASGIFLAEDERADDEALRQETGSKCPNFNVEDPTRRIWIFTTAR